MDNNNIKQFINFEHQKKPKVSIIIPIYNVEKYLNECVSSALRQTLKDIEIICVNDGSTDNSLNILLEIAQKDKRVLIIDKQNEGYGKAINVGMYYAKGNYIGILESDDLIADNMYERLYDIASNTHADIVKGDYYKFWGDINCNPKLVLCKLNSNIQCYNRLINPTECLDIFQFNTT